VKILFVLRYTKDKASSRIRGFDIAEALKERAVDLCVISGYSKFTLIKILFKLFCFDVIYFQKRYSRQDLLLNRVAKLLGKVTIFDIDDAPAGNTNDFIAQERAIVMANISDAVFCGSHNLKSLFEKYNSKAFLIPSAIDIADSSEHEQLANRKAITIGWIGDGISYKNDLLWFSQVLKKISKHYRGKVNIRFMLIGALKNKQIHECYASIGGIDVQIIDSIDWKDPQCIESSMRSFDIGVYPLLENEFNSFKCGYKAIQYMALGIPVVGSPLGENNHIIRHRKNGLLAKTEEQWEGAIAALVEDEKLYAQVSQQSKQFIEDNYALKKTVDKFIGIIERLMSNKICMLVPEFDRTGGYELQALALSLQLKKNNDQVFILTNKAVLGALAVDVRDKIEVLRLLPVLRRSMIYYCNLGLKMFYFFIRYFKRFDIIHSHALTHVTLMFSIVARLFGKKSIIKIATGGDLRKLMGSKKPAYRMLIRLLPLVNCCVSLNDHIEQELLESKVPKEKIFSITNGVDTDLFKPILPDLKSNQKNRLGLKYKTTVIFVGRFEYRKGADILIDAWSRIFSRASHAELIFLGFGVEESVLKEKVKNAKMGPSVQFRGKITEVYKYLQAADIAVIPSRREGNPNALLEAMASGLPVIASRIAGIEEYVCDGMDALLFNSEDIKNLTECLMLLLHDEPLRQKISDAARKKAAENFSIMHIAKKYNQLYERLRKI